MPICQLFTTMEIHIRFIITSNTSSGADPGIDLYIKLQFLKIHMLIVLLDFKIKRSILRYSRNKLKQYKTKNNDQIKYAYKKLLL